MDSVDAKYKPVIKAACVRAGAVGVPGAFSFGLDVAAMGGIWALMTIEVANKSGHKVDKVFATKLVTAVIAGIAGYVGGSKLAMKMLHFIPGAGTIAAVGVNSFLNLWFTWRMGKALATLFEKGDFSLGDVSELTMYILTIITPLPGPSEIAEVTAMMTDTSLNQSITFKTFQDQLKNLRASAR